MRRNPRRGRGLCGVAAAAALGLAAAAEAQLALEVRLDHSAYLLFERIPLKARVRNDTDQILVLGGARRTSVLEFEIERDGRPVARSADGLLVENEMVLPGETRDLVVDVRRFYDMQTAGRYHVKAGVVGESIRYLSPARVFDIVPGLEIVSLDRPLTDAPGRVRTYSLRYWDRAESECLFLSILEKKAGANYGVFPLGPVVRVRPPEVIADGTGSVTVRHLSPSGAIVDSHFKSTADNVVFLRQTVQPPQAAGATSADKPGARPKKGKPEDGGPESREKTGAGRHPGGLSGRH